MRCDGAHDMDIRIRRMILFLRRFILVQCKIKKMSAAILGYGLAFIFVDINLTWRVALTK